MGDRGGLGLRQLNNTASASRRISHACSGALQRGVLLQQGRGGCRYTEHCVVYSGC